MIRRKTKRHTAIHNIFSQSKSQIHRSFLRLFITQRIIIERACHTGHGRIITFSVLVTNDFLQNDSHLFLVYHVRRSLHISLAVTEVYRSIHSLDGIGKHTQHLIAVVQIRNHIRIVNPRKRLIMGIFQQRRRTDGNR